VRKLGTNENAVTRQAYLRWCASWRASWQASGRPAVSARGTQHPPATQTDRLGKERGKGEEDEEGNTVRLAVDMVVATRKNAREGTWVSGAMTRSPERGWPNIPIARAEKRQRKQVSRDSEALAWDERQATTSESSRIPALLALQRQLRQHACACVMQTEQPSRTSCRCPGGCMRR
jgi:hypothetical protein